MKKLSLQLVKNDTPMCVQTQMSGLMVTLSLPLLGAELIKNYSSFEK
jgi:hypothetical protein